ncbi:putative disease resistance protein RGA1 [Trifolium pratense]|uniref:putative disease resistance protein RGA1 n=1 Tax=Trifolium pratense TaxID=57577 RepID=UPI001E69004C|nr:putative disease resistance protein RGA1 [Trifolium pratense]
MGISVPYVLNGLIPEESWSLLKKITFGNDTKRVNNTIESICKKIAVKCRGVPLSIRSLGGILQSKSEEREWIDVLQGDFWKLCEDKDSILPVLKLSYQNLSPQQRQCFAYCSLYPKDWVIRKDSLIQMWMAQGYLECSIEDQFMEDVGNQFVNIFLMKSLFQDAKMNQYGEIDNFKMHDLMHDLATQVAGSDCCYLDNKEIRCIGRPLHVSVEFEAFCLLESLDATFKMSLCVGVSCTLSEEDVLSTKDVSKLFNLRHLELHGWICRDKTQSVGFGKLSLQQHGAMIFSKWLISPLTNITEIYLNSCRGFEYLPPLERLPFLKSLELASLNELKYIYYEEPILKESFFPSLESLQFGGCKELRGWRKMGDDFDDINSSYQIILPQFPCLSKLVITWCWMLTCIPTFPTIKILYMKDCTVEILEETLNIAASQYSVGFTSLSMLKYLKIN